MYAVSKVIGFIFVGLLCGSCKDGVAPAQNAKELPVTTAFVTNVISKDTLLINAEKLQKQVQGGKRTYQGKMFTGYAIKKYTNDQLKEKILYINGKREGKSWYWFKDGTLQKTRMYADNKLNGTTEVFYPDGSKLALKNYANNQFDGLQQSWHKNGQMFKQQHFVNGREEGFQEAWMSNGKKFVNYEARNGRIFGLKRMNLCFGLEDETVKIED